MPGINKGTDRYAMPGSEHSHSPHVVLCDVGGDDQDGGIRVTQLVVAVHLTEGPALIRETLRKQPLQTVRHTVAPCSVSCGTTAVFIHSSTSIPWQYRQQYTQVYTYKWMFFVCFVLFLDVLKWC